LHIKWIGSSINNTEDTISKAGGDYSGEIYSPDDTTESYTVIKY